MRCSPNEALEAKSFSTEYWRWQHRFLLDAVIQYGRPSLFLTITPYEWTFPFPHWLQNLRQKTGIGPTSAATFETMYIVHVLEQLERGYLYGSNTSCGGIMCFITIQRRGLPVSKLISVHRFEFQDRGTVHLRMFVWLKDFNKIKLDVIRADIP